MSFILSIDLLKMLSPILVLFIFSLLITRLVPVVFRGQGGRRGPGEGGGGETRPVTQQHLRDGLLTGLHGHEERRLPTAGLLHVRAETAGQESFHQNLISR